MKDIKDYLHLYLGCECMNEKGERGRFAGLDVCTADYGITMLTMRFDNKDVLDNEDWSVYNDNESLDRIKLILRPLFDMTEDEFKEFKRLSDQDFSKMIVIPSVSGDGVYTRIYDTAEAQNFLLSKGFDLFGLIDAGLAIDKTTLK